MKTRIIDCTLRLLGQSGLRNFTMDAATGYLCRDVSQETISSVVSDFLTRFFFGNDLRPPVRRHTPAPELLLVFTRGLCTIKGRAYLDRRLKNNTLK